jgi:hypothetical protein
MSQLPLRELSVSGVCMYLDLAGAIEVDVLA